MKIMRAMATVGGITGLSRIAGFARDVLMASILGAGPMADAFFVALKLPNFFRRVSAEGAFSVSFVPVYTEELTKHGEEKANVFASQMLGVMVGTLSLFCVAAMIMMPYVVYLVAPGFHDDPDRLDLAIELSRITFPYLLFMSVVALIGGILNSHKRFAPFAFAPVLFNLCLIAALLGANLFESAGHALAWGVLLSGLVQLVWLVISAYRAGIHFSWQMPRFTPEVMRVIYLMGPGVLGAGVMHVNLFADLILASFLEEGSISYLYYADRLNQLPLGMIGIAVGTALLPLLSEALQKNQKKKSHDLFLRAMGGSLFLAVPAAVALGAFAPLMIETLFERGAFDGTDTIMSAAVLRCYVIGLPAYIMIKVFSTVHWAGQNTVTPVKISMVGTVFNIALSLALIQPMGVAGIALATALSGWVQVGLHYWKLQKHWVFKGRGYKLDVVEISGFVVRLCFAATLMAVLAFIAQVLCYLLPSWGTLAVVVMVGLASFALTAFVLGLITKADIKELTTL